MDSAKTKQLVDQTWDQQITPQLVEYIKIPCKSPAFDADWEKHGYMDQAVEQISAWCQQQVIEGLQVEVIRLPGRTPLIFMEVPGDGGETVLLYGHLDKQPEMVGWHEDLGPWKPVIKDGKLYGRGGADDGYAAYASLTAIRALQQHGGKHGRCVILIEACEESGSFDLPFYIEHLQERIGSPTLVVCLDSGCGNYDQLWCTTSLRGMVIGKLSVEVLEQGVHSGDASGIVPSSFRVLRQLLSRLEDENTGEILPAAFHVEIPSQRIEQAAVSAKVLGDDMYQRFPFPQGAGPVSKDREQLVLNRTWTPFLAVTGAEGLPALGDAGNVMRPSTSVMLSLRLPPTCDADAATEALQRLLEKDPPYGARVSFAAEDGIDGWDAPEISPWLMESIDRASHTYFGREAVHMGEGGSIPFMGMLGEKFPKAQFMITGVLGPHSNAHGPNEFLHLATGKRLTCCVAQVLEDHYLQATS